MKGNNPVVILGEKGAEVYDPAKETSYTQTAEFHLPR
jgi:hypothetical protein